MLADYSDFFCRFSGLSSMPHGGENRRAISFVRASEQAQFLRFAGRLLIHNRSDLMLHPMLSQERLGFLWSSPHPHSARSPGMLRGLVTSFQSSLSMAYNSSLSLTRIPRCAHFHVAIFMCHTRARYTCSDRPTTYFRRAVER